MVTEITRSCKSDLHSMIANEKFIDKNFDDGRVSSLIPKLPMSSKEGVRVNFIGTYVGLRGHFTRDERLRKKTWLLGYIECFYFVKTKIGKNSVLVFFSHQNLFRIFLRLM